jgi:acyl-CoA dehydrogenase
MEILKYTEDHINFRKRVRKFMEDEIIPNVEQWEKDHIVPREVWRKMGREKFLCTELPAEYGGMGGDFLYSVILLEEISKTNHSGLASPLHSDIVVPYITSYASEEQKKKYLPGCVSGEIISAVAMTEPGAGSDLASIMTTAEEDGDFIVINGSKTFISSGINADLVIVAAKDPKEQEAHKALSLYLVEAGTPGFSKGKQLVKMGWHSQDTSELFFSNCRISRENRLGEAGSGFRMLMEKLQQERLIVAIMAVASAECALEMTIPFCQNTIESGKPLTRSQAVQFALVEMATEVKIGRTFLDKLIADHMEGRQIIIETSMAKYWTTDMVERVLDRCIDLFGEYGILEKCPITRAWRDVRVMSIFAGTNEIMKQIAAKFMGF